MVRVLFAAMPDKKQGEQVKKTQGPSPRDNRLSALTEEFNKVEFKDAALKKLCLVLLSTNQVAGRRIAKEVAAAYDPNNVLVAFAGDDSTRLTQETRLAKCHLDYQLHDGDCTAYVDLMTRVGANAREDDYQFGQSIGPFIKCAISALHNKNTKPWTRDECKAIGKALRGLLNDRDYVNINDFQAFSTVLVALSCRMIPMTNSIHR